MNQQNNDFNSFVLGFIIGGILGVLYAPAKGGETRKTLKKLIEEWSQKGEELSKEMGEKIEEVREEAQPLVEEARERVTPIIEEIKPIAEQIMQTQPVNPPNEEPRPAQTISVRLPKRPPKFFQGI